MVVTGLPKAYSRGLATAAVAAGWEVADTPAEGTVAVIPLREDADCAAADRLAGDGVRVLALVSPLDRDEAAHALAHRALPAGWDWEPEEIVEAAAAARTGKALLPTGLLQSLVPSGGRHEGAVVSEDELRWLTALARGATVVRLADDEGYSERAMFRRLADLYTRLGAGTQPHRGTAGRRTARDPGRGLRPAGYSLLRRSISRWIFASLGPLL